MKRIILVFLAVAIASVGAAVVFSQVSDRMSQGKPGFGGFRGGFAMHDKHKMIGRLFRRLDLTDEQKEQMKAIRRETRETVKPLRASLMATRKQLTALGTDGAFEQAQVEALAEDQAQTIKQILIAKQKAKAQMFAILTPKQKARAAEIRAGLEQRMRHRKDMRKKMFGSGRNE